MKYPKRSQYKYAKSPYRIRNWPEYEEGLRRRGDLTIWFSNDAINSWRAPTSGRPGAANASTRTSRLRRLWRCMVFQLPLRQTEGFLRSLADMLEVENTMYRYKMIVGRSMRSRTLAGQRVVVQLSSKILNTINRLGMPDNYRVA